MAAWIRQSTARTLVMGPFLDSTDFKTPEIALDITEQEVLLSKNGGAFTLKSETTHGVHDAAHNGFYTIPLDTTDTNTLGLLTISIQMAGALPVWAEYQVVEEQVWDSFFGSDLLDVNDAQLLGTAYHAPALAGVPYVDVHNWVGAAAQAMTGDAYAEAVAMHVHVDKIPQSDGTVTWNATAAATIQTEANDALVANNLDHLALTATAAADMTTEVADNTILSRILGNGDTSTFVPSTDGLHAAGVDIDAILADTNELQVDDYPTSIAAIKAETALIVADTETIDTAAEIAAAVWGADATTYQAAGTFGLAIGDPAADAAGGIYKGVVTDAAGLNVAVDVVAMKADTTAILLDTGTTLDGRIPAALVGGRMDASVGAVANDAITAASINTGALTADAFAADAIVAATLATGAITADAFAADAIVAATLATGVITADAFAANAIVAATLNADCITAAKVAADVTAEIADGVWDEVVNAGHAVANSAAVDLVAVLGDTAELQTDWMNGGRLDLLLDTASGGGTPATIADAVWDEVLHTDHEVASSASVLLQAIPTAAVPTAANVADAVWDEVLHTDHEVASSASVLLQAVPTAAVIVDATWDEVLHTDHEVGGSASVLLQGASAPTAAVVADAVWDEVLHTDHEVASSASVLLQGATAPAASAVADAVWDEVLHTDHEVGGSASVLLQAAGGAADPLLNAVPGAYVAGSAGYVLGTNLDAKVSDVPTAAEVWAAATRTLTSTAAATTAAVSGSALTVVKGVSFAATLSGMTIPATWSKILVTAKESAGDTDAQAQLQIQKSVAGTGDGLLYVNAKTAVAAGLVAADASLTVNQAAGTIAIVIDDEATAVMVAGGYSYDVKCLLADGTSQLLAGAATLTVADTVTAAIV